MKFEKLGSTTKELLIPVGLVITLLTVAYFIGGLNNRVKAMEVKDSPSREEFRNLGEQLNKIQTGVDSINSYLRPAK